MSDTTIIERDQRNGRFVTGNFGGPGRKPGSKNRLGEQYLQDLQIVWQEVGIDALRRCAAEDPTGFCRIISGLLPKDVDINVSGSIDVGDFATRFRHAVELLGNQPGPKTIEHVTRKPR
jgi:hypothetical protein